MRKTYYENNIVKLYNGDCVEVMNEMISENIKINNFHSADFHSNIRQSTVI